MAKIGTKGLIPAVYRANLIQYKGHWSIGENEEETLTSIKQTDLRTVFFCHPVNECVSKLLTWHHQETGKKPS